ncbi:kinase-like domain-containing protein [Vararia minispora EC-137]|uniref:Kinase-like domain-containing protein n=1 Tax=Vararia minispora EC-137 TaxID=1314806 RepID=A0ACB8Q738_9AGAM|nr:kinase-like domain-containing protein [Vararia minispora EC-137]
MSDPFDVIPFDDIKGDWKKLGSGSFGNVYKGSYLGIDVAIKEILPSSEYDVPKYFEREWRLLKESRHPNVVLYLGLSRAPDPDGRIFIISEFVENGNVRQYIWDKSKPFPWRLRISFATDITRALAYLHARKCIHRDLKGENLLVTANGRLKITDFGFARIAARNEEESRRLTFCGTDAYMSPEILLGNEFDLPTDVFSLGVIFAEIAARKLADDRYFKRAPPSFQIDPDEIHELASPGCPEGFAQLAIDCLAEDPRARPSTREILERLRFIEAEILARPSEGEDMHTGSIKFMTGNRRPGAGPRIPSFGHGVGKNIRSSKTSEDESEDELVQAVMGLKNVTVHGGTIANDGVGTESQRPLIQDMSDDASSDFSEYSTTVIRAHSSHLSIPTLSSVLTVRASPNLVSPAHTPGSVTPADSVPSHILPSAESVMTIDSYYTAGAPSAMSIAAATEGGSTLRAVTPTPAPAVHRFTLIRPGAKRSTSPSTTLGDSSWGPLEFFTSGLLGGGAKCDICAKRLGRKLVLECDDCGLKAHLKCGEASPLDCGVRAQRSVPGRTIILPVNATSTPLAAVKHKANGRK